MFRSPPRPFWVACALVFAPFLSPGLARTSVAHEPRSIEWRTDLPRARADAASRDRLIWAQFSGPWCHQCRRMDGETFVDPRVVGLAASDFVPVKLGCDEHEELALSFGLTGLPATVILRPTGEVVARVQGYLAPESYLAFLQSSLTLAGRSPAPPGADVAPARRPAMGGYCPVSLVDGHRLVTGREAYSADHDGDRYLFADAGSLGAFRKAPERYVPVNGGRCPVAQVDRNESRPGSPRWGVLYEGHLFLCGDEAARKKFLLEAERFSLVDVADRGFCPHCRAVDGVLVRGQPSCSLTRGGRRYLFPDKTHLEAFLSSAETTRR